MQPLTPLLCYARQLWGWKQIGDWQQNVANYASWGVKNALFVNESVIGLRVWPRSRTALLTSTTSPFQAQRCRPG
jgi:hypothetical protein